MSYKRHACQLGALIDELAVAVTAAVIVCSPHFGIAHAMCLGLAPWLAAEVPYMVEAGVIQSKV